MCARGGERNLPRGRGPWTEASELRPGGWVDMCCVRSVLREVTASFGLFCFFFTFPPATPPMSTLWDEHTSIAQCSTKCCVKRTPLPLSQPRALALSLHVEGKNGIKRYDITREQTGLSLPTDKSTSLSTHGSHSDTQSSPRGLIWNDELAFS